MKKLLTILGSLTMIGTAGATVVACGNKQEATPKTPLETLTALISDAEALIKDKEGEAVDTLIAAIADAKQVADNKESTEDQIKEATNKLEAAIKTYNDSTSTNLTEKLSLTIQAGTKALIDYPNKVQSAKTTLIKAIDNAVTVLAKHENDKQLTAAISTLEAAIKTYNEAEDGGETDAPNIKNLALKVKEATEIFNNNPNKLQAAKEVFIEAIGVATSVIANPQNQGQVDTAVKTLETAIDTFINSNDENVDNMWRKLQEKIVELDEAITGLVNLKQTDSIVKLAKQILTQIKDVKVAEGRETVLAAINNANSIIADLIEQDKTDFSFYENAKTKYAEAKESLVNEPKDGLIQTIEDKITKFDKEIKDSNGKILTDRIKEMAKEINDLVKELTDFDVNIDAEQTTMKELNRSIVKLATDIRVAYENNGDDEVLVGLNNRGKKLETDSSKFLEDLMAEDHSVNKEEINAKISEFKEAFEQLQKEFNEHKGSEE